MRNDRQKEEQLEKETFEAYGEYTYDYQHQPEGQPNSAAAVARAKRAHRRNQTGGFFKFLILLVILTVGVVVVQQTVFRLETVYVVGNEQKTPQQVVTSSGLTRGSNMLSIQAEDVAEVMARDHTIIFEDLQKEYPSTIYLYIRERKTVAAMQWLGMLYTLDDEGMVMRTENSSILPAGLPVITGFLANHVQVGQKLVSRTQGQLEAYCEIMKELQLQLYADQVSEINLANPENIYLVTVEGVTVRLGGYQHMQAKIGAVRTYMAYLRQLGNAGGILDVTTPEDAKYMPER